jgi:hypothetical protein
MQSWTEIYDFPSEIIEVMASNDNSDLVAVGCSGGIWVSKDGCASWNLSLET